MEDVDNGGSYASVRAGGKWEISTSSSQFCCKPRITIKRKVEEGITSKLIKEFFLKVQKARKKREKIQCK